MTPQEAVSAASARYAASGIPQRVFIPAGMTIDAPLTLKPGVTVQARATARRACWFTDDQGRYWP